MNKWKKRNKSLGFVKLDSDIFYEPLIQNIKV